jgi:hypothetical protein
MIIYFFILKIDNHMNINILFLTTIIVISFIWLCYLECKQKRYPVNMI